MRQTYHPSKVEQHVERLPSKDGCYSVPSKEWLGNMIDHRLMPKTNEVQSTERAYMCFDFFFVLWFFSLKFCCQNYMLPWSDRILPRIGSSSLVLLLEVREAAIHPLWKIQFAHSLCLMFCSVVLIFLFVTSHSRLHSLVAERHPMDTWLALKFERPTSCPRRRRSGFC